MTVETLSQETNPNTIISKYYKYYQKLSDTFSFLKVSNANKKKRVRLNVKCFLLIQINNTSAMA